MQELKNYVDKHLTDREMIIYLLVVSGMSYRDIAKRLLTSHQSIYRTYYTALKKFPHGVTVDK